MASQYRARNAQWAFTCIQLCYEWKLWRISSSLGRTSLAAATESLNRCQTLGLSQPCTEVSLIMSLHKRHLRKKSQRKLSKIRLWLKKQRRRARLACNQRKIRLSPMSLVRKRKTRDDHLPKSWRKPTVKSKAKKWRQSLLKKLNQKRRRYHQLMRSSPVSTLTTHIASI